MAGGGNSHPQFIAHSKYPDILVDPAVERWYHMKENTHVYYRMTPRTVKYSLILGLGIPALCYWIVQKGEVRKLSFHFI
jgi:hypothetical protein